MDLLRKICVRKAADLQFRMREFPLELLQEQVRGVSPPLGFLDALRAARLPALIPEIKKAIPVRGVIRVDYDPVQMAKTCRDNGAACLSVLTEKPHFQGLDEDLICVREAIELPLLRRDFIIDPYQVYESRLLGADCVSLIMGVLDDGQARGIYETALALGMDVIPEAFNLKDLERALFLDPETILVNNHNPDTFQADPGVSYDMIRFLPDHIFKLSDGGIHADNLDGLHAAGYDGFFIDEILTAR
jgi:indole-3-glycerol phosphate synthase